MAKYIFEKVLTAEAIKHEVVKMSTQKVLRLTQLFFNNTLLRIMAIMIIIILFHSNKIYAESRIFECLGRPFLINEAYGKKCNFEPPFRYRGPFYIDSFKKSPAPFTPEISVNTTDQNYGLWIFDSSWGYIVIGKAKIVKDDKKFVTTDPLPLNEAEMISLINSKNPIEKATGIWMLTKKSNKNHIGKIIEAIDDKDPIVKLYSIYAVGILGKGHQEIIQKLRKLEMPTEPNDFLNEDIKATLDHTINMLSPVTQ